MKIPNLQSILIFAFFCFYTNSLITQNQWANFVVDDIAVGVEFQEDYAWFASRGGLVRIDRKNQESLLFHTANTDMPFNYIKDIAISNDGVLWVLCHDVLGKFVDNNFIPVNNVINDTLELSFYKGMHFDSNNNLIINSKDQQGVFNNNWMVVSIDTNDIITVLHGDSPTIPHGYYNFLVDDNDNLWLDYYDSDYPISMITNNGIIDFDESNSPLINKEAQDILNTPDGNVLIIQQDTLGMDSDSIVYYGFFYDGANWETVDLSIPGYPEVMDGYLRNVFYDKDGNLWFNQDSGDIIKYDGDTLTLETFGNLGDPQSSYLNKILNIDENGHSWIYQNDYFDNKLFEIHPEGVTNHILSNSSFESTLIQDIYIDNNNTIWVTDYSGLSSFDGVEWERHLSQLSTYSFYSRYMSIGLNGDLWLTGDLSNSIPGYDIAHFNGLDWTFYNTVDLTNQTGGSLRNIEIDSEGNVWVALYRELLKYDGNNWTFFDYQEEIEHPGSIKEILITSTDEIYVYTYDAIFKKVGDDLEPISSFPPNIIFQIYEDKDGILWITYNGGVALYDGANVIDITQDIPFEDIGAIYDMTEDLNENYWFATYNGLFKYDGISWELITGGYPQWPLYEIEADSFNNIWIGTSQQGVVLYNENGINNIGTSTAACLEGTTFLDINENGIKDNSEFNLVNQKLQLLPDSTIRFSSFLGKYKFLVENNSNKIVQIIPNQDDWYLTSDSVSYSVSVEDDCIEELDFGVNSTQVSPLGEIQIIPGWPRCFTTSLVWIMVKNPGFLPISGSFFIEIDEQIEAIETSPPPTSIVDNLYYWDFEALNPLQTEAFNLEIQYPGEDAIGQEFCFKTTLFDDFGNILDEQEIKQELLCSYDPNDKSSESTGAHYENYSLIEDALEYLIRFENTGNDTAFRVVIRDTLSKWLDINSFELIGSSHPVEVSIQNRIVEFVFHPIFLPYTDLDPIGSQGFVKFRIAPKSTIPDGQVINNLAQIYFDFNPAITTNTTENILVEELPFTTVFNKELLDNCNLNIYPNPFNERAFIDIPDEFLDGTFKLFNSVGMNVKTIHKIEERLAIEKNGLSAGIYFFQIMKNENRCGGKLLIN